ncbi:MAG: hypothetical protein GX339_02700 [Tissierellia bacterium]|nr:hypothetical protein [Tissierellia bacterium]
MTFVNLCRINKNGIISYLPNKYTADSILWLIKPMTELAIHHLSFLEKGYAAAI